ncbi:valine--tRNA ligase [Sorochytrium milnesiophthora]
MADNTSQQTPEDQALSKNQAKNEAKRKAKMDKFLAKQQAMASKTSSSSDAVPKSSSNDGGDGSPAKKDKKIAAAEPAAPTTPHGEKKDMSQPMASAYNPKHVEEGWGAWWEQQGFFKPQLTADGNAKPEGTYVIPIPPPNITGSLHLGHALTTSIQDCMTRWNRMHGKTTLYNPGCDHAGIGTQSIVEKRLFKDTKQTRHDLGRDAFLKKVWEWKEQYGNRIYDQFRRLGSSGDMSRACFTMDPKLSNAVKEAFVRLQEEGTIYRATRLVNWCSVLNTALSNIEVVNKDLKGKTWMAVPGHDPTKKYEFGVIVSFAYPIENSDERIIVATTRIETMLGDSGIAVNPSDERYKHLHGKFAIHPFNQRRIPIVADDYVDASFGTGAVKITPAHDPNDFDLGKRHKFEFINILTDDGCINENGGQFKGLKRFDARVEVTKALKEKGLYIETKDNPMVVPTCFRSGDVIEPRIKPQWYVNCQEMAKDAMEAVRSGQLEITPQASEKEWFRWLENIQDWCISRQLWWGHRIPAYLIRIKGRELDEQDDNSWVSGRTEEDARKKALDRFPDVNPADITLSQDEDVLDTWFSSALWPFSIFGWPEQTKDLELFYPTSLLETGWDILFFWVARMVMFGIKFTGRVPFKKVFCHAMVRDAHGRKMSKSLGNVIDPLDVIEGITLQALQARLDEGNLDPREVEKAKAGQKQDFPRGIPECGTDALRFALCAYTSTGRDLNLDVLRMEGYRKFCNKLWNATRFALMKLGDDYKPRSSAEPTGEESMVERWILHKLNRAIRDTNANLETMNFMNATSAIHQFWLYELCDVYIEASKPIIDAAATDDQAARKAASARATLYTCLDQGLKLLHPLMPFVTEELWQRLPRRAGDTTPSLVVAKYPTRVAGWENPTAERDFDAVNDVVRAIRSMMADYNVQSNATVYATCDSDLLSANQAVISALCKGLGTFSLVSHFEPGCVVQSLSHNIRVALQVRGIVDLDAEVTKARAKLAKAQTGAKQIRDKTLVDGYETKVKSEVRQANEEKLKAFEQEVEVLNKSIENFLKLQQE